jgi:hypothetical protein
MHGTAGAGADTPEGPERTDRVGLVAVAIKLTVEVAAGIPHRGAAGGRGEAAVCVGRVLEILIHATLHGVQPRRGREFFELDSCCMSRTANSDGKSHRGILEKFHNLHLFQLPIVTNSAAPG